MKSNLKNNSNECIWLSLHYTNLYQKYWSYSFLEDKALYNQCRTDIFPKVAFTPIERIQTTNNFQLQLLWSVSSLTGFSSKSISVYWSIAAYLGLVPLPTKIIFHFLLLNIFRNKMIVSYVSVHLYLHLSSTPNKYWCPLKGFYQTDQLIYKPIIN